MAKKKPELNEDDLENLDELLNDRQYKFAMEYIRDSNGAKAARRAGYCADKPQNARVVATRLLTNVHIKAFIAKHKEDLAKEINIGEKEIIELCLEIMTANVTDYIDLNDYECIKLTKDSPNKRAIASVKIVDKDGMRTEEIKLRDPLRAAERVAKLLGLDKQSDEELVDRILNININHVHKGG